MKFNQYTSKAKDQVLKSFYSRTSLSYKENMEIIEILCSDGYVELRTSANGSAYCITDKGKGFILEGGYTKQDKVYRKTQREKWSMNTVGWIVAIAASIISSIITSLLS